MLADRTNMVFRGTAVTSGRGTGVVVATAMDTQIGMIAALIEQASEEPTPLEREIQWLGKMLGIGVVVLAAIVVGAIALTSDLSGAADVIDALLVGMSLAVAAAARTMVFTTIVLAQVFNAFNARRWLICAGLASTVLLADEVRKLFHRRTPPSRR